MLRNKYKDDYRRMDAGQYEYTGRYYTLPLKENQKRKAECVNFAAVAGFLLLELAGGILNPDSSRTFWIVFPYLFLFLPTAYMWMGAFAFHTVPVKMQRSGYEKSLVRMRRSCLAVMVLAGIQIFLDLLYIFWHLSDICLVTEILYLLCFVSIEILGILYGKKYDRMYSDIEID